ncbi:hypothetical protein E4U17_003118 [Claviceps sp. LM77 group G4]|nr:hypothetical protein E4U17_003118 [Claviceps sp. LM77 group G4]KAG6069927.1 hypothetical protein E4U33_004499 [Claviceps sp. LM78 group G4]KAG6081016.1 hypothetical protein E4U16_007901 [Claviceps sp. LM84 group G4]
MDHSIGGRNYQSGGRTASAPRSTGSDEFSSKLRETCHACSLSKVRCSKEKPSCSRCAKRGVTCEYIVTKRPGRKRDPTKSAGLTSSRCKSFDAASAGPNNSNANCAWLEDVLLTDMDGTGGGSTSHAYLDSTQTDTDLPMLWPLTANEGVDIAGDMSDFLMPLITPLSCTFTARTPDFLSAAADVSAPITPPNNYDDKNNNQPMQDGSNVMQLLLPDGVRGGHVAEYAAQEASSIEFHSSCSSRSLSSVPESILSSSKIAGNSDFGSGSSSCECLIKALDIMAKISSTDLAVTPDTPSTRRNSVQDEAVVAGHGQTSPLLHATFMANKQTIEALSNMLHGSCQENVYLLTCMSMIVFKVLRRYETAAGQSMSAGVLDVYEAAHPRLGDLDRDSLRRTAAQLVLGELHLVQQLVSRLSRRLQLSMDNKTPNDGADSELSDSTLASRVLTLDDDNKADASAFSAATLSQMEHDLRNGLARLSSNIINMLRRL